MTLFFDSVIYFLKLLAYLRQGGIIFFKQYKGIVVSNATKLHNQGIIKNIHIKIFIWSVHSGLR